MSHNLSNLWPGHIGYSVRLFRKAVWGSFCPNHSFGGIWFRRKRINVWYIAEADLPLLTHIKNNPLPVSIVYIAYVFCFLKDTHVC